MAGFKIGVQDKPASNPFCRWLYEAASVLKRRFQYRRNRLP